MASPWGDVWSPQAERVVSRLLAELPPDLTPEIRSAAKRLWALPIGWDLWSFCFLRVNGEVVLLGEDEGQPESVTIRTEPGVVLGMLVWGSKRYPELKQLLPDRGPRSVDCRCLAISLFADRKVLCSECGGLGWLPAGDV